MKFIDTHHDAWHTVGGEDGPSPHPIARDGQLLTLEQWHAVRDTWPEGLRTGVILSNTVDVQDLQPDLDRLALVVLQFPKWTDGRAYTQARLLRRRLRYAGEVRATGDVVVDMLPLLQLFMLAGIAAAEQIALTTARPCAPAWSAGSACRSWRAPRRCTRCGTTSGAGT